MTMNMTMMMKMTMVIGISMMTSRRYDEDGQKERSEKQQGQTYLRPECSKCTTWMDVLVWWLFQDVLVGSGDYQDDNMMRSNPTSGLVVELC